MGGSPSARLVDPVEGYRPRYRADIDGLRAIAVLAVIVYHFWGNVLPVGYLGVDAFFVISGFLITRILVRENEAGDYSIMRFYDRRIRRILPALLVMMAAATAVVWLIYLPSDAVGFAKSVVATLAFLSNDYFWRGSVGYFLVDADTKPLLHTWSLGIEEQFYIGFPILVWALMKLGSRRLTLWGIGTIAVLSLALATGAQAISTTFVLHNPLPFSAWKTSVAAFYLLPARAWELGLGAGLAVLGENPGAGTRARTAAAAAALALLLAALALIDPLTFTPLPPPTLACLSTTALIWLGQRDNLVAKVIGARPLVAIGLASYSLYLWHWPVYVLGRYFLLRESTATDGLVMAGLTAVLGALSWRFVEQPFRGHRIPTRHVLAMVMAAGAAVGGAALALLLTHGAPGRFPPAVAVYDRAMSSPYRCPDADRVPFGGLQGCLIGAPGGDADHAEVVLFGNSHAAMFAPAIGAALARRGLHGLMVTTGGCLPFAEFNLSHDCVVLMREGIPEIAALRNAGTVIMGTTWLRDWNFVDPLGRPIAQPTWPQFLADMQRTLDQFVRAGKHVVLVGPVPRPAFNPTNLAARELALSGRIETPMAQPRAEFDARFGPAESWLSAQESRVTIVRPWTVLCDRTNCAFQLGGRPAYLDNSHISVFIMPSFEPLFDDALDKALAPSKSEN